MKWWACVELFCLHYTLGVVLPNMEKVMRAISQLGVSVGAMHGG